MVKVKVSEASGAVLDWLVSKCENDFYYRAYIDESRPDTAGPVFYRLLWKSSSYKYMRYSSESGLGGPILDRERISVRTHAEPGHNWVAFLDFGGPPVSGIKARQTGPTMLVAGLRCFVTFRLGEEVEVPEELLA